MFQPTIPNPWRFGSGMPVAVVDLRVRPGGSDSAIRSYPENIERAIETRDRSEGRVGARGAGRGDRERSEPIAAVDLRIHPIGGDSAV